MMHRVFLRFALWTLFFTALFPHLQAQPAFEEPLPPAALMPDTVQYLPHINDPFYRHVDASEIDIRWNDRRPWWLFAFFVLQLALVGYARASFPKSLNEMVKALFNINMANQLYREQDLTMPLHAIAYNISFVISGGIFLYLLNHYFGWVHHDSQFVSMLFFLWAVIVLYSFRYGSLKFVSLVFPFSNVMELYNFNFFLVQKVFGLVFIPLNLLIAYAPVSLRGTVITLSLIVLVVMFLTRSLKGLVISRNYILQHGFHFFVYLCALEIAPVCILTKAVVEWVN